MKSLGLLLVCFGLISGFFAFRMETTVQTGYPGMERVNNFGLMDERRNGLIVSGLATLSGILLFGFGSLRRPTDDKSDSDQRDCPHCAERIKGAAKVCRYCNREVEPIQKADLVGPSGKAMVGVKAAQVTCWTCNHFQQSEASKRLFGDRTKGSCSHHGRATLAYETCSAHSPKQA